MSEMIKTMKLHIHLNKEDVPAIIELTKAYQSACDFVSSYIFDHDFLLNTVGLNKILYQILRTEHNLKSQLAQSCIKTVVAKYKAVKEQLFANPYWYLDETGTRQFISRTLEWLQKPIRFSRPQADLVRGRDYSFMTAGNQNLLSLNTLKKRIRVTFDTPNCFQSYFDGSWKFGTGKIVNLLGEWYLHIPMTKECREFSSDTVQHVVGIDRGLRFLVTSQDEKGKTIFLSGNSVIAKRNHFNQLRAELQSKGTKSAKRILKRISGRENRWMTDVNHQISKTLVTRYGVGTLFAIENLSGVSFSEENLSTRNCKQRNSLRSWTFYQLEQFLIYKAQAVGSNVVKIPANYTSQRCPKCGHIHKKNRNHMTHEYCCDHCGYRSNDDRVGAMNIQMLGNWYLLGNENPQIYASK